MKLRIKIGLLMIMALPLMGCGGTPYDSKFENNSTVTSENNRFQPTGKYYSIEDEKFDEILDTETGNLYLCNKSQTYGGYYTANLIPLLGKDKMIQQNK